MKWLAFLACLLFGAVGVVAGGIAVLSAVTGHYVWAVLLGLFAFMCGLAIRNVISPRGKLVRLS